MSKREVEKKLWAIAEEAQKIYLKYLDSLKEEGNEIGKEEGYLSITIFRDSLSVTSAVDNKELKEENQIDLWESR